jgi:hypothetical protein
MPVIAAFRALRRTRPDAPWVRDDTPALYRYEILGDERRTAFFCRIALEGTPRPAQASEGPVVFRYVDERGWVDQVLASNAFDEVARAVDEEGTHVLSRVDRVQGVQEVVAQFEDRELRLESGGAVLEAAAKAWKASGKAGDAAVLAILAPEGQATAHWRMDLIESPNDEPRPRSWQELAGDAGPAQFRMPKL